MKRKLLFMFAALLAVAQGTWADNLYLVVDGKNATLKYGTPGESDPSWGMGWSNGGFKSTVTSITVDASCASHDVTNFSYLFGDCEALETITDLSNLKTAGVTDMSSMFEGCSALTTLDLSSFNTASVINMGAIFHSCSSLTTLDLSSFNTAEVKNMGAMFLNCSNLTTLDLSSFNTANVTTMSMMFLNCSNLAAIYVGAGWSTDKVVGSGGDMMFLGCTSLPGCDGGYDKGVTYAHSGDGGYLNKMAVTAHDGATGEYWTTFYDADRHFIAPTGTKVFKVALSGTHLTMYEVEDRIVNRYMPVVLKSTGANIVMTVSTSSAGDGNPNDLSGWAGPGNMAADGYMYVLNNGTQGVGFYKLKDGKSLSPGKAFLYYTGSLAREFFGFDEATGIDATLVNSEKVNSEVYDLQGRRVAQPTKGLYIVNGKKVVIK